MFISEVIKRVDELYPNSYSEERKLSWCYEVSSGIRRSIRKIYDVLNFEYQGTIALPDGIGIEDVDTVFINGKKVTKVDDRTFRGQGLKHGDCVRIVYQVMPNPYTLTETAEVEAGLGNILFYYQGIGDVTGNIISVTKDLSASLELLKIGASLTVYENVAAGSEDVTHTTKLLDIAEDTHDELILLVVQDLVMTPFSFVKKFTYTYKPDYLTECESPFDVLYLDYVMAQIAYYQNDLTDYNKFVTSYNQKLLDFSVHYKETNPIIGETKFQNLW